MSRSWVVTKRRRVGFREYMTDAGERLDNHVSPMNPAKGIVDVGYEGPAKIELPVGSEITISNRSGERKKI